MFPVHSIQIFLEHSVCISGTPYARLIRGHLPFSYQRHTINWNAGAFPLVGLLFYKKGRLLVDCGLDSVSHRTYSLSITCLWSEGRALCPALVVVGTGSYVSISSTEHTEMFRASRKQRAFARVNAIRGKCALTLGLTLEGVESAHSLKIFPSLNSAHAS